MMMMRVERLKHFCPVRKKNSCSLFPAIPSATQSQSLPLLVSNMPKDIKCNIPMSLINPISHVCHPMLFRLHVYLDFVIYWTEAVIIIVKIARTGISTSNGHNFQTKKDIGYPLVPKFSSFRGLSSPLFHESVITSLFHPLSGPFTLQTPTSNISIYKIYNFWK